MVYLWLHVKYSLLYIMMLYMRETAYRFSVRIFVWPKIDKCGCCATLFMWNGGNFQILYRTTLVTLRWCINFHSTRSRLHFCLWSLLGDHHGYFISWQPSGCGLKVWAKCFFIFFKENIISKMPPHRKSTFIENRLLRCSETVGKGCWKCVLRSVLWGWHIFLSAGFFTDIWYLF